jgi:hypothetical protein
MGESKLSVFTSVPLVFSLSLARVPVPVAFVALVWQPWRQPIALPGSTEVLKL